MLTWMLKWLQIFWRAGKHFYNDDYTYKCSALAFITVLAIVPVLSIFAYAIGILSDFSEIFTALNKYIYANFVPASAEVVQNYFDQFTHQASHLPIIGIIFSMFTGLMLLLVIEQALNQIFEVHHKKRYLVTRLIGLSILMLLPFYIGFSSFLSEYIYNQIEISFIQYLLIIFLNLIINTTIFAIFYIVVPNKILYWKEGLTGGLITAILFEFAKKIFVWYVAYFSNYSAVYGALAIFPIFLTWLYVSWALFLYGALCIKSKGIHRSV